MPDVLSRIDLDAILAGIGDSLSVGSSVGLARLPRCCNIDSLSFGRLGGETNAYAVEQNFSLRSGSNIRFDFGKKRIAFTACGVERSPEVKLWVDYHQIERAFFVHNSSTHVLLILRHAARIEVGQGKRQTQINPEHGAMAQVLNRQLLVRCVSAKDRDKFEEMTRRNVGSFKVSNAPITITADQHSFSRSYQARVERLMAELSGPVGFKIDDLLRDGSLTPAQVLNLAPNLRSLESTRGPKVAERVLRLFAENLRRPTRLTRRKAQHKPSGPTLSMAEQLRQASLAVSDTIDDGRLLENLCLTRFAIVTPTGIDLAGPLIEQSNSTLRLYGNNSDNFLRVSFREEDHELYFINEDYDVAEFIRHRFTNFLINGITVGGRTYDFYACSSNGLREQTAVFVHEFTDEGGQLVNAATMRKALGTFDSCEKNPAKLLSRLGQSLSTTQFGAALSEDEIEFVDDIYSVDAKGNRYCHTDGCGTISPELAREIDDRIDAQTPPIERIAAVATTCFQIRLGGCKGMLSIDPRLTGRQVRLRPSMQKFTGTGRTLDIAKRFSFPSRAFTNKSLIQILEALGVQPETLLSLQKQAIAKTISAKSDWRSFVELLSILGLGFGSHLGATLAWLVEELGLDPDDLLADSFNKGLVDLAALHSLKELKFRARIPLPTSHNFNLVGIADEDGLLEEGEVYICIHERGKRPACLEGVVAISRSPSNHPGDVQRARAVGRVDRTRAPHVAAQENCVVFSTKGDRPLSSMLSGGDLDGDLFVVMAQGDLIPPQSAEPAEYMPAQPVELAKPANRYDMVNFFVNHTIANCVGRLANLVLHYADHERDGMFSPIVLILAEKLSHALDSSKSGREIDIKSLPRAPASKPDFMQKEFYYARFEGKLADSTYESQRVNGHLFRAIGKDLLNPRDLKRFAEGHQSIEDSFVLVRALIESSFGRARMVAPSLVEAMSALIQPFTDSLYNIATVLSPQRPLTEQEILLATIAASSRSVAAKGELTEQVAERGSHVFSDLRRQLAGGGEEDLPPHVRLARVWGAIVAVEEFGMEWGVRSFVWIALSELRVACDADEVARAQANGEPR